MCIKADKVYRVRVYCYQFFSLHLALCLFCHICFICFFLWLFIWNISSKCQITWCLTPKDSTSLVRVSFCCITTGLLSHPRNLAWNNNVKKTVHIQYSPVLPKIFLFSVAFLFSPEFNQGSHIDPWLDLPWAPLLKLMSVEESSWFSFLTSHFTNACLSIRKRKKHERRKEGGKEWREGEVRREGGDASLSSIPNFSWYIGLSYKNSWDTKH